MSNEMYNCIAPKTEYFRSAFTGAEDIEDVHKCILDQLAIERGWVYDNNFQELPESTGKEIPTDYTKGYVMKDIAGKWQYHDVKWLFQKEFDNGDFIQLRLYDLIKRQKNLEYDAVLFHWNSDRSTCSMFNFPIYAPDDSGVFTEYYERSSQYCHIRDHVLTFRKIETYADSADIHDHGHEDIESGFIYDIAKDDLRYYSI